MLTRISLRISASNMRELLIATSNEGKLREMLAILEGIPFTVLSLADIEKGPDVEEPAETFEGNAIIKAFMYGKRTGKLTLAEDTGLEVDALNGGPGVRTARYDVDDKARNEKLLRELAEVPDEKRGATFKTVAAIYDPSTDKIRTCYGECRGAITRDFKGTHGFGFSPLFHVNEANKRLAEMTYEEMRPVNHRGKAVSKARDILLAEFAE